MLPDPDSNQEVLATPAERGTSADPVQAEAATDARTRFSECPPLSAEGNKLPCENTSISWAQTLRSQEPSGHGARCPFSGNACAAESQPRPVIIDSCTHRILEEHRHQIPEEHQIFTSGVIEREGAVCTNVEDVFVETFQLSDGGCNDVFSVINGASSSDYPTTPNCRKESDDFLESDLRYLEEDGPEIVDFFKVLIGEGRLLPGDCGVSPDSKPAWVDDDKVRLGQQFAQKYFFGLVFAEMISLFLLFSSPGSLQPLIFSGNSDTPFKAFRRYLSTVCRVRSWYSGDLWAADGEAQHHLRGVRQLHAAYRRRLNGLNAAPPEERARRTALRPPLWTRGAVDAVREDFGDATRGILCPFFSAITSHHEWINQMEMSVTQFGFVALAVTYPERFGAGGASEDELDAFVHLWRVLGHLLGVEDRFNFCAGGLHAMRQRSKVLVKRFMAPALAQVEASWEHMTRCVVEGVSYYVGGMTYEVALLYLCDTVGVAAPHVLGTLSAQQRRIHRVVVFLLRWALRLAPIRALFNWLLNLGIKRAQAASPEWLRSREARVYDYARSPQEQQQEPPATPVA